MSEAGVLQLAIYHVLSGDLVVAVLDDAARRQTATLAGAGGLVVRAEIVRQVRDDVEAPLALPPPAMPLEPAQVAL